MKKIFLSFLIFLGYLTFVVTSPSIAEASSTSVMTKDSSGIVLMKESPLEPPIYEGYYLADNQVKTNLVGEYKLVYKAYSSGDSFEKTVTVIDGSEYFSIKEKNALGGEGSVGTLYVSLPLDNDWTACVAKLSTPLSTPGWYRVLVSISFYYQGTFKYSITLLASLALNVIDAKVMENRIVVVGTIDQGGGLNKKLIVYCFEKNGDVWKGAFVKEIGGSKETLVTSLAMSEDSIYVSGKTNNNDGDFIGSRSNYENYLVRLDYTGRILDLIYPKDEEITGLEYYNGKLAVMSNPTTYKIRLRFYNQFLEMQKDTSFSFSGTIIDSTLKVIEQNENKNLTMKLLFQDGKSQILTVENNYTVSVMYEFSTQFGRVADYVLNHDAMVIVFDGVEDWIRYYENEREVFSRKLTIAGTPMGIGTYEGDCIVHADEEKVYLSEVESLKVFKTPSANSTGVIPIDYFVFMNGLYRDVSNLSTMKIGTIFGKYKVTYSFTSSFTYIFEHEIHLKPYAGVINAGVYDVGVEIRCNGTGYLNGELLLDRVTLFDEGIYDLVIHGLDGEVAEMSFEVKKLSVSLTEDIREEITTSLNGGELVDPSQEIEFIASSSGYIPQTYTNWYFLLPIISTVFSLVIIYRKH